MSRVFLKLNRKSKIKFLLQVCKFQNSVRLSIARSYYDYYPEDSNERILESSNSQDVDGTRTRGNRSAAAPRRRNQDEVQISKLRKNQHYHLIYFELQGRGVPIDKREEHKIAYLKNLLKDDETVRIGSEKKVTSFKPLHTALQDYISVDANHSSN